jgi:hypothetical protein
VKISGLIIAIVLLVIPVAVYGQSVNSEPEYLKSIYSENEIVFSSDKIDEIKQSCPVVQSTMAELQNSTDKELRNRLTAYSDAQKELKALEIRISKQGADASELDLLIGKIQQSLDEMNSLGQEHVTLTRALAVVDCRQYPQYFAVGIQKLRQTRDSLSASSRDLKSAMLNSKQSTFEPLAKRLSI